MLEGSNPTFKWTVDDKPFFTYYNTVLNVIYQHAAVYKLTVSFSCIHVGKLIPISNQPHKIAKISISLVFREDLPQT